LHPNPNKFLSVLFSFIPGAGHMYLGLLKRGASIMAAFAADIIVATFFSNTEVGYVFGFLLPVIWFVASFDFWRYPRMSPEEKALVQDDFIIPQGVKLPSGAVARKVRIVAGILLILAGAYQLYQHFLWNFVDQLLHSQRVIGLFHSMPYLLGSVGIIVVGLLLIFWKSRQLKREAGYDEK
jgi:hypothetical protein